MPPNTIALSEIPTLSLLYKLGNKLAPPPQSSTLPKASAKVNSLISLIRNDITKLEVGAIVNAANNTLLGGGGVDGAIHAGAGLDLVDECRTLDGCATGSAKITKGYELPAKHVIHAVGPIYWRANHDRPGLAKEQLKGCYRTSLDLANEHKVKSIAFSAISTGAYGYPSGDAAKHALEEVRAWIDEKGEGFGGLERIIFCCFERKDEDAYQEYISHYFPPTESDSGSSKDADKAEDIVEGMPDPPTTEPATEGEPEAKKQKTAAVSTEADEWEHIEKPDASATDTNGYPDVNRELRSTSIDEDAMTEEEKEQKTAALHTATMGGDVPVNALEKDW